MARLATLLEAASSGDMRRWWGNLAQDEAERSRERHVRSLAARERMGEYSISLDPSQSAALRAAAGAGAANARIVEALREGLAAVREEARGMTEAAMRDAVAASERLLRDGRRLRGEDLDVRTVRMDAETHARLQLQAHELGVKLPELCRYAVGLHLRRHAHVDPDRDAMGIDPFAGMDRQAFGATARRLGIPRDLLAGFRDRQIELDTVPPAFMARLCDDLPRPVPVAAMRAHLSAEPRLSGAMMFRADGKPAASGRKTFEEAARDAGMPEEEVRRLLSE
ncbi:hypothetical protein [Roseicella aerolata]|uniref:Uncharacterized protein n=1 Tax=Roseicella aerolata TaxID=2883479 RepID=A0A9X1IHX1_9PROT|nr:hypothetical protein [Roseicella aerolata]MCB4824504.1 hypothetical protein [Roseicella aerolata]